MSDELKTLIGRLSPACRQALKQAADRCASRSHYNVEVEHFLVELLELPGSDFDRLLRDFQVSRGRVRRELEAAMERFKRGNSRTPAMSPLILRLFEEAWLRSSLDLNATSVRSGGVLLALLEDKALRGVIVESAPTLLKVRPADLAERLLENDAPEQEGASGTAAATPSAGAAAPAAGSALDLYTIDLTQAARRGKIDPIRGRDAEIRQIIDILCRRRQNNPILTGEAGVGKTAVVEGLAQRIVDQEVPPELAKIELRILDLGLLQAGAGIKGEFENRLKSVVEQVGGSPTPIVLFIDEAHTLIGAGGQEGGSDAANLLKPALARGELRTIAATTWAEYKKYFEKDPALARRFQVVKIEEPDLESAVDMLRGVVPNLEEHHGVRVLDEAVREAVRLSQRYISGRQLPDKGISVLDTACARVAVSQSSIPPPVEDIGRRIERLEMESGILLREAAESGADVGRELGEIRAEIETLRREEVRLEARWRKELDLVAEVRRTQSQGLGAAASAADPDEAAGEDADRKAGEPAAALALLKERLAELQGEAPMVPLAVDSRAVADVVAAWTGIPVGRMVRDEIQAVLDLENEMGRRLLGQPQALAAICRRIATSRADLDDPGKPVGVFLLAGPSGVGKTETALSLAELLYGGERNLISINLSEYQEAHSVSGLKGAPPGYVGYGSGGVLTEAVRRRPYSVVLLDEVEKAHPDVLELFYQVFDKGILEDGEGVPVDFKNTVILLTSNVGSEAVTRLCLESPEPPPSEALEAVLRPELARRFPAAFLGRLVPVPYRALGDAEIRAIVELKLGKIRDRVRENHRMELTYGEELVAAVADRCTEVDSGARNVDHILTHGLLPELATRLLERMAAGETSSGAHVSLGEDGAFDYRFFD